MIVEEFHPSAGLVVGEDPKPALGPPKPIPTDSELILAKCHSKDSGSRILEFDDPDSLFDQKNLGPMEFSISVPDLRAVLYGNKKKTVAAVHAVQSVAGFSYMPTLTETVRADAAGLEGRPLLAMTARLYYANNFVERLKDPQFTELVTGKKDEYLSELDQAIASIRAIGSGTPATAGSTTLVEAHLGKLNISFSGKAIDVELDDPCRMLSSNVADNEIYALACPVTVNEEQFPMPQRDFVVDRLETEKQLVATFVDVNTTMEALKQMSDLAREAMVAVFEQQLPYQQKFYALQQACVSKPGKRGTPFRLVNRSLKSLAANNGRALNALRKQFPGRRATDFSASVDTILCLDEITSVIDAQRIGEFAHELRAVAPVVIHANRCGEDAIEIHKKSFGTLHGIRKESDSWKRHVFPVAGSYLADTDNPFLPIVAIPHAAFAAGLMIEHADEIAVPPSGDQRQIQPRGAVSIGYPQEALKNTPDAAEMPGVNRVASRTPGFCTLHGASTLSGEPTFQLVSVTRTYNDLVKHISELCLTKLFTADDARARNELKKEIDKLIMSKSGSTNDKSLEGGKVVSIENAVAKDGTPMPGVVEIRLAIRFKYILFGVLVKVIPEDLVLLASNAA